MNDNDMPLSNKVISYAVAQMRHAIYKLELAEDALWKMRE